MPQFVELPYAGGNLKEKNRATEQAGFNGYFLRTAAKSACCCCWGEGH